MKRLLTIALVLGVVTTTFGQSTSGWKPMFKEDFSNNKNGWGQSPNDANSTKIHFDQKVLISMVSNNDKKLSSGFTKVDFNEDFILKAVLGGGTKDKNSPNTVGLFFGHTHHKNFASEGWYSVFLDLLEDVVTIRSGSSSGSILFERSITSASYDNFGKTEIGVKKEGNKMTFYLNGNQIYENEPTKTTGSTITFAKYGQGRGNLYSVDIFEKDIPPTPEEIATEKAITEAVTVEEKTVILEAVSNLEFDTGKSTVRSTSYPALNKMAEMMVKNTKFKVILKGHTDDVGDPKANQTLSQSRVNSVIDYLVGKGIDKGRFVGLGYGDKQPIADNDTPEGRQMNRRVEFEIIL